MESSPAHGKTQGPRVVRPWREVWAVAKVPMAVSTWFGAGFLPIAPGTWGSLAAIPIVHVIALFYGVAGVVGWSVGISLIGIHASHVAAQLRGVGDPSEIVVDEVAGQSISLIPIYAALDVVKPGPIRRMESLPGGFGIMCDDLLAGAVVAVLLGVALFFAVPR